MKAPKIQNKLKEMPCPPQKKAKKKDAWNWPKKNLPFMRLILEEQQKYLQSFINNATYHPMNPDADVTYQTVNLFSSDKCFICFISDCPHYIRWNLITILKYEHIIAPHVSSTSIFTRIVQTMLCWFWNHISSTF